MSPLDRPVTAGVRPSPESASRASSPAISPTSATPITTAAERRLRLIIESAPVSLIVVDRSGQVLAANRATLALFDRPRFEDVVGLNVGALAATESREPLAAFAMRVCDGEAGSLEYLVTWSDGSQRRLETHAVPIRRSDDGVAVFLGASWDVAARDRVVAQLEQLQGQYAFVESERDSLRRALDDARTAASHLELQRTNERALSDDQRQRLYAALSEVEKRHAVEATEWTAERESLTSRLASADRERAEFEQLLHNIREQHASDLQTLQAERDRLAQAVLEVNAGYAALVSERGAERAELEAGLKAERVRSAELINERDSFRTDLSAILQTLQDAGVQTQQLFDRCRTLRLVTSAEQRDTRPSTETLTPTGTESEEGSWQF